MLTKLIKRIYNKLFPSYDAIVAKETEHVSNQLANIKDLTINDQRNILEHTVDATLIYNDGVLVACINSDEWQHVSDAQLNILIGEATSKRIEHNPTIDDSPKIYIIHHNVKPTRHIDYVADYKSASVNNIEVTDDTIETFKQGIDKLIEYIQ